MKNERKRSDNQSNSKSGGPGDDKSKKDSQIIRLTQCSTLFYKQKKGSLLSRQFNDIFDEMVEKQNAKGQLLQLKTQETANFKKLEALL